MRCLPPCTCKCLSPVHSTPAFLDIPPCLQYAVCLTFLTAGLVGSLFESNQQRFPVSAPWSFGHTQQLHLVCLCWLVLPHLSAGLIPPSLPQGLPQMPPSPGSLPDHPPPTQLVPLTPTISVSFILFHGT